MLGLRVEGLEGMIMGRSEVGGVLMECVWNMEIIIGE